MEVLLLTVSMAVIAASNIFCFVVGAKVGQSVTKGEKVELPSVKPMKDIREKESRKEAKYQQDKMATIMENISAYDGTSNGQKDVPMR